MIKVKICGITNLKDALACVKAGSDALGFIFYKKSRRYIKPENAKNIIRRLPAKIIKVGVFVNSNEKKIKTIAKTCSLDILQFHGNESARFCRKFKGYRIIKAFGVGKKIDLKKIRKYRTFAYLFDSLSGSKYGGTGKTFDWRLLADIKHTFFLSGGLSASNVSKAIKETCPVWIDACSSLERAFGKKDHRKVRKFIKLAKKAEQ